MARIISAEILDNDSIVLNNPLVHFPLLPMKLPSVDAFESWMDKTGISEVEKRAILDLTEFDIAIDTIKDQQNSDEHMRNLFDILTWGGSELLNILLGNVDWATPSAGRIGHNHLFDLPRNKWRARYPVDANELSVVMRAAHASLNSDKVLVLNHSTVGELAYLMAHNGHLLFRISGICYQKETLNKFREATEDSSALAWMAMVPDKDSLEGYIDIALRYSFDDVYPYLDQGIRNMMLISQAIDNDVDASIICEMDGSKSG